MTVRSVCTIRSLANKFRISGVGYDVTVRSSQRRTARTCEVARLHVAVLLLPTQFISFQLLVQHLQGAAKK